MLDGSDDLRLDGAQAADLSLWVPTPERAHLGYAVARERTGTIPLGGERRQPLGGEAVRHVAHHLLFGRGDHG